LNRHEAAQVISGQRFFRFQSFIQNKTDSGSMERADHC